MKKSVRILIIVLLIICVGVFCYAGYTLISKQLEYKASEDFYNGLSEKYTSTSVSKPSSAPTAAATEETIELDPEISPKSTDWNTLLADYPDIVGWIYLPGTNIDYPVAKYDDNSYYLNRQLDGSYNSGGTLFVECLNQSDFSDDNTMIYGHHMNDGSMFAKLIDYSYQDYYNEHPVMYLNTPTMNYRVELFAGFVTSASSDVYTITLGDDDSWNAYIESAVSQSKFESAADVKAGDRILTLSTCTYEYDDARFVVLGKLVPIH